MSKFNDYMEMAQIANADKDNIAATLRGVNKAFSQMKLKGQATPEDGDKIVSTLTTLVDKLKTYKPIDSKEFVAQIDEVIHNINKNINLTGMKALLSALKKAKQDVIETYDEALRPGFDPKNAKPNMPFIVTDDPEKTGMAQVIQLTSDKTSGKATQKVIFSGTREQSEKKAEALNKPFADRINKNRDARAAEMQDRMER